MDSVGLSTGGTACRFVVLHLKDNTLTWWCSFSKDSVSVFNSLELDELLDELRQHFSDMDEEMKLRDRLLALKQTGSVSEFVSLFENLQLRLGTNRLDDMNALYIFTVGLKPFTSEKFMLERPDTFEDAVLLAQHAE